MTACSPNLWFHLVQNRTTQPLACSALARRATTTSIGHLVPSTDASLPFTAVRATLPHMDAPRGAPSTCLPSSALLRCCRSYNILRATRDTAYAHRMRHCRAASRLSTLATTAQRTLRAIALSRHSHRATRHALRTTGSSRLLSLGSLGSFTRKTLVSGMVPHTVLLMPHLPPHCARASPARCRRATLPSIYACYTHTFTHCHRHVYRAGVPRLW